MTSPSSTDTEHLAPTHQEASDSESTPVELRKSSRERKLALKAKENRALELSRGLVVAIDKQLELNENFLDSADTLPIASIEEFMTNLEEATQSISDTFNEIKSLDVENDHIQAQRDLFQQYVSDTEQVREYYRQRLELEEGSDLQAAELAVQQAKQKLEEEMRRLEVRMAARQERHALRRNSASLVQHNPETQRSPIQQQRSLVLAPTEPAAVGSFSPSPPSISAASQSADIAQAITEHMHISLVAPPEPSVFSGDPLQYADWRVSFDSLIDSKRGSPIEKLHRLKKYVSGDALEAISGYFRLQTTDAYSEALKSLQDEFGRDDLVENSFRDKLEAWPKIANKDCAALKKYSYFLKQCLAAQSAIPNLKVLDDKRENKKLIKALPEWLINRWTYIVTDQEERSGFPPFKRYVDFVAHEAKVLTNNLRDTEDVKQNPRPPSRSKPVKAFKTNTSSSKANCLFCNKGLHQTTECRSLTFKDDEQKDKFIREQKLCFACLKPGHHSKACTNRAECMTCKKPHATALHGFKSPRSQKTTESHESRASQKPNNESGGNAETRTVNVNALRKSDSNLLCMTLPVYVSSGNGKEHLVYALLDTQSDASFITTPLLNQIQPENTRERITMATLNGNISKTVNRCQLNVRGYHSESIINFTAYEQGHIPCNRNQIPNRDHVLNIPHLKQLFEVLPPKMDIPVGILLGVNCSEAMTPQETVLGDRGEPFAIKTALGWTLCGDMNTATVVHKLNVTNAFVDDSDRNKASQNDLKFLTTMEEGLTKLADGSCCLPLPFKEEPTLPNNKEQAQRRHAQLQQKLQKDPAYKAAYTNFVEEMIENGHAEIAPETERKGKVWYIPHFGVFHPKKKKLRVVFDASAKYMDRCLNEELLTGPDQINSLVGILLRFRKERVAISCDIEKMFHNFHVTESHRDFLRFLWDGKEYRMTRHLFGATSSPGVTTFALRKIAQSFEQEKPSASKFIVKDFYVDDGITSVSTTDSAVQLVKDTREICKSANLRLHKFVSNDRDVLASIPASEIATDLQEIDLLQDKMPRERTLGLEWCVETDTIGFTNNQSLKPATRRGILSVVSQLYDPLGLLAPFTIRGKIISQKACQENGKWDDEVSPAVKTEWARWLSELDTLNTVKIKRCIKASNDIIRIELHHFCDASLSGYGACSYLRTINRNDEVTVTLVMAKSRVAPLKPMTVPRLELQAAVEAVRLSATLRAELDMQIDSECFWSDSKVVLGYIRNSEARFYMFVANRVKEIRSESDPSQWYHVPGKLNPADMLSRGSTLTDLQQSAWWEGPEFLHNVEIDANLIADKTLDNTYEPTNDPEIRKVTTLAVTSTPSLTLNLDSFSKWTSMVRAVANVRAVIRGKRFRKVELTSEDLAWAEEFIVKKEQERRFSDEVNDLKESRQIKRQSRMIKLSPYLDNNGILRINGRVKNSTSLTYDEKHPILLDKSSNISKLIVKHFHEKTHHQGQTFTLAAIRQAGYWIAGALGLIKSLVNACVICRLNRAKPASQQMGLLPSERTELAPPFTHVGIDTFGHFIVKDRRSEVKRWGLVFTCMYTRAVHIEVLEDLTTDSFLQALRCFQAVRGPVKTLFSDAGTNFMGGKNEMEKDLLSMKNSDLKQYLTMKKIAFQTNTPGASHQGGVWERQIRSIRAILNGMSSRYAHRMSTAALRTAFYEVAVTINSKPLSADCLNSPDQVIITPNHLLTSKSSQLPPPPGDFDSTEIYGRRMYRKTQQMAEEFWTTWKTHYLTKLQTRQKWQTPEPELRKGDVVMLVDDNLPRNTWRIGSVTETQRGNDEQVRNVTVRVADTDLDESGKPSKPPTVLRRPVQKLVMIMRAEY